MPTARWRVRSMSRSAGLYWLLETGRNETRRSLSLGYVTEDQAHRARAAIQAAEDSGDAARVLALHAQNPEDGIAYLLGDPGKAELLPAPSVDYSRWTLRDYFTERYAPWRSEAKPRTWRTEEGHWRRILEGLGALRLGEIVKDPRLVYRWLRNLRVERSGGVRRGTARSEAAYVPDGERDKPASGAYQRLLRAAIQALLNRAYTEGDLDTHTKLADGLRLEGSTRAAREKLAPLTKRELAALLDASEGKIRGLVGVAAGLGLRPSELCRLRWEHVRWTTQTIAIPGTKTEASADEVPLTPVARAELTRWWKACGEPSAGVMFPADDEGNPYTAESGYKRTLATAARRARIDRPVTPYLLRHSFATIAVATGVPKDTARRIMRHSNASMLDRVYNRPSAADLVESAAAFDLTNAR